MRSVAERGVAKPTLRNGGRGHARGELFDRAVRRIARPFVVALATDSLALEILLGERHLLHDRAFDLCPRFLVARSTRNRTLRTPRLLGITSVRRHRFERLRCIESCQIGGNRSGSQSVRHACLGELSIERQRMARTAITFEADRRIVDTRVRGSARAELRRRIERVMTRGAIQLDELFVIRRWFVGRTELPIAFDQVGGKIGQSFERSSRFF